MEYLDYLTTTGSQYIDIYFNNGQNVTGRASVYIKFQRSSTTQQYVCMAIGTPSGNTPLSVYIRPGNTGCLAYSLSNGTIVSLDTSGNEYCPGTSVIDLFISWKYGKIIYYNISTGEYHEYNVYNGPTPFVNSLSGVRILGGKGLIGKIYYAKVFLEHTLTYNLVPCKDNNNVVCFYDIQSGQFFYNNGSGSFSAGPTLTSHKVLNMININNFSTYNNLLYVYKNDYGNYIPAFFNEDEINDAQMRTCNYYDLNPDGPNFFTQSLLFNPQYYSTSHIDLDNLDNNIGTLINFSVNQCYETSDQPTSLWFHSFPLVTSNGMAAPMLTVNNLGIRNLKYQCLNYNESSYAVTNQIYSAPMLFMTNETFNSGLPYGGLNIFAAAPDAIAYGYGQIIYDGGGSGYLQHYGSWPPAFDSITVYRVYHPNSYDTLHGDDAEMLSLDSTNSPNNNMGWNELVIDYYNPLVASTLDGYNVKFYTGTNITYSDFYEFTRNNSPISWQSFLSACNAAITEYQNAMNLAYPPYGSYYNSDSRIKISFEHKAISSDTDYAYPIINNTHMKYSICNISDGGWSCSQNGLYEDDWHTGGNFNLYRQYNCVVNNGVNAFMNSFSYAVGGYDKCLVIHEVYLLKGDELTTTQKQNIFINRDDFSDTNTYQCYGYIPVILKTHIIVNDWIDVEKMYKQPNAMNGFYPGGFKLNVERITKKYNTNYLQGETRWARATETLFFNNAWGRSAKINYDEIYNDYSGSYLLNMWSVSS